MTFKSDDNFLGSEENLEKETQPGDIEAEEERGVEDVWKSATINYQLWICEGVAAILAFSGILSSIMEYEIYYMEIDEKI